MEYNIEKLNNYLDNNCGYITSKELKKLNINYYYINKFIESGIIERVNVGLYKSTENILDDYYVLQQKYSYAIFSYNSAFFLLNLSERVPINIDMTIPRTKKIRGHYNIHRISDKYYNIGITEVVDPMGNTVKIYNAERSICDMIKTNGLIDLELQNRILNNYFNSESKNIDLLINYSKIFGIYDKINLLLEVMMKW